MDFIGIIGAMEEEVLTLKDKMDIREVRSIASLDFFIGEIKRQRCVVVRGGIGKVNSAVCAQILIDVFHVDAIINTGVAGALHKDLEIGDVVISREAIQHDVDAREFGYELGEIPRMDTSAFKSDEHLIDIARRSCDVLSSTTNIYVERIVSGDQFVASTEKKHEIIKNFNPYCTEMEGAAIAQVGYLNKVPTLIIRSISDKADASADVNFQEFAKMAALTSCKIIERMFELV